MAGGLKPYKKPSLRKFEQAAEIYKGAVGKIAEAFNVNRISVYRWCKEDPAFDAVIENYRGKLFDECLKTARIVALGIPKLDKDKRVIGWKEKPDSFMLRYLMGTLGRKEGYGESVDITSKGESIKPDPVIVEVIDSRDKVAPAEDTSESEEE